MDFIKNPALWASLAALLDAIGIPLPHGMAENIIAAIAALCALIGMVEAMWQRTKPEETPATP